MKPVKLSAALMVASMSLCAAPAIADPLAFSFNSTLGPAANFSFTLDSSPTVASFDSTMFQSNGVKVDIGGTTASDNISFFIFDSGGGLSDVFSSGGNNNFDLYGAQLFSGSTDHPMFSAGSFDLLSSSGAAAGSLTISAVPEPATWAMMLIGFGAMGASLRRRPRRALAIRTA